DAQLQIRRAGVGTLHEGGDQRPVVGPPGRGGGAVLTEAAVVTATAPGGVDGGHAARPPNVSAGRVRWVWVWAQTLCAGRPCSSRSSAARWQYRHSRSGPIR